MFQLAYLSQRLSAFCCSHCLLITRRFPAAHNSRLSLPSRRASLVFGGKLMRLKAKTHFGSSAIESSRVFLSVGKAASCYRRVARHASAPASTDGGRSKMCGSYSTLKRALRLLRPQRRGLFHSSGRYTWLPACRGIEIPSVMA